MNQPVIKVETFNRDQLVSVSKSDDFLDINKRSRKVRRIQPLEIVGNILKIRVGSATESGKWYVVAVRVLDKWDRRSAESFRSALMKGRIAVRCSDPSYKYWGYHFFLTVNDATVYRREWRYPIVRNPNLKGTVCKHIRAVLDQMVGWRFSTMGESKVERKQMTEAKISGAWEKYGHHDGDRIWFFMFEKLLSYPNLFGIDSHRQLWEREKDITIMLGQNGDRITDKSPTSFYTGRYDSAKKIVTILPPKTAGQLGQGSRKSLVALLIKEFPEAEQILLYDKRINQFVSI